MHILMVAAENDAIPNGKVGGIGDVVRDIPIALAQQGNKVEVVIPGYQALSLTKSSRFIKKIKVKFAGHKETIKLFQTSAKQNHRAVKHWLVEHPLFAICGPGKIYCNDPPDQPFASDATKFALFCTAVAKAVELEVFGKIDVLHLHDWHSALVAMLRAFSPEYPKLQKIKTVYTIHNLALQGIRPLAGDSSSLKSWFPKLAYDPDKIIDPRYPNCVNPMRLAINLSDKVHAVSPTYAQEILQPSNPKRGYFGGEGLEQDLQKADREKRLAGILNGCEYPDKLTENCSIKALISSCKSEVRRWHSAAKDQKSHQTVIKQIKHAQTMINRSGENEPFLLTSVGRITAQKMLILQQQIGKMTVLEHILNVLGNKGLFILLGSGEADLEQFLDELASRNNNFIFLKGYSDKLANMLYKTGDLFLMPSSFEPCGISQMLAMRAGQPCLVHSVGGLRDTVKNNINGFSFAGNTLKKQAKNLLSAFKNAIKMKHHHPQDWKGVASAAADSRFLWSDTAVQYMQQLYSDN